MRHCCLCNARIEGLDFYFHTAEGCVCSSCLVVKNDAEKDADKEAVTIFTTKRPAPSPVEQHEMSLGEVRRAVWNW